MIRLPKYKRYVKSWKIVNLFPQKIKYFHRNRWRLIMLRIKSVYIKKRKFKNI
jgi:hypothetical protein